MNEFLISPSLQDEDLDIIYDELLQAYGAVTFEAFINLLVSARIHAIAQLRVCFTFATGRYNRGPDDAGTTPRRV